MKLYVMYESCGIVISLILGLLVSQGLCQKLLGAGEETYTINKHCTLNIPAGFTHRRDCVPSEAELAGWYCYQAINGELVDMSFNVSCSTLGTDGKERTLTSLQMRLHTPYYHYSGTDSEPHTIADHTCKRKTDCSLNHPEEVIISNVSHIYSAKTQARINGAGKLVEAYLKIDTRYEKKNLTWLVTDERFWYHIMGDNLHIGANAEATSYPSPDRYTLTTDNNTILMDHNDTYKRLSYTVNKTELSGVDSLTLTVYSRSLTKLERTIRVLQIFKDKKHDDLHSADNKEALTCVLWKVLAFVLIGILSLTVVSHVILLRKQICSLFHSMKKRLRQRPAPKAGPNTTINVQVNNYPTHSDTLLSPPDSASIKDIPLSEIEAGENAPSTRSNSIHDPVTGDCQSIDECLPLRLHENGLTDTT